MTLIIVLHQPLRLVLFWRSTDSYTSTAEMTLRTREDCLQSQTKRRHDRVLPLRTNLPPTPGKCWRSFQTVSFAAHVRLTSAAYPILLFPAAALIEPWKHSSAAFPRVAVLRPQLPGYDDFRLSLHHLLNLSSR